MSFNCARAHACSTIRVRENPSGDWWKRARGREGKKARASWLLINTQLVATVRYPCDARFRSTCLNVPAVGGVAGRRKKIQKLINITNRVMLKRCKESITSLAACKHHARKWRVSLTVFEHGAWNSAGCRHVAILNEFVLSGLFYGHTQGNQINRTGLQLAADRHCN